MNNNQNFDPGFDNQQSPNTLGNQNINQGFNYRQNSNVTGFSNQPKSNKKILYLIGGGLILLIILIALYFAVFKKEEVYNDYDDYLKEEEKINEKLNKNYTIKDYKVVNGILVELKNNNNMSVDVDFKIEFYDENGNVIDVKDSYMYAIPENKVGYELVYIYDEMNYSTYKVIPKLSKSTTNTSYLDKVTLVSNKVQDDKYIVQLKNDSDKKLDVYVGLLFIGENNSLIAYEDILINELNPGETLAEKAYIPYDENYEMINYKNVEVKILNALPFGY